MKLDHVSSHGEIDPTISSQTEIGVACEGSPHPSTPPVGIKFLRFILRQVKSIVSRREKSNEGFVIHVSAVELARRLSA